MPESMLQPPSPLLPALPDAWAQVLDEVEATLRRAETEAAQRGQAISPLAPSPHAEQERVIRWQQAWERLEKHREGWPTILQQAEKAASEADSVLRAGEEALRHWLNEAEAVGQSLVKWAKPEV